MNSARGSTATKQKATTRLGNASGQSVEAGRHRSVLQSSANAQLLTLEKAVGWAKSMTWNAISPIVGVATKLYANGVKLTKKEFAKLASRLQRTAGVERCSVRQRYSSSCETEIDIQRQPLSPDGGDRNNPTPKRRRRKALSEKGLAVDDEECHRITEVHL